MQQQYLLAARGKNIADTQKIIIKKWPKEKYVISCCVYAVRTKLHYNRKRCAVAADVRDSPPVVRMRPVLFAIRFGFSAANLEREQFLWSKCQRNKPQARKI